VCIYQEDKQRKRDVLVDFIYICPPIDEDNWDISPFIMIHSVDYIANGLKNYDFEAMAGPFLSEYHKYFKDDKVLMIFMIFLDYLDEETIAEVVLERWIKTTT